MGTLRLEARELSGGLVKGGELKTRLLVTCCLVLADWTSSISAQIQGSNSSGLHSDYRDLESPDPAVRKGAFEKLRSNRELLNSPETAERLLTLLLREREDAMRRVALGLDVEDGLREQVLGVAWELWADRMDARVFRIFATDFYNPGSEYARSLGAKAGRFADVLLELSETEDRSLRECAAALSGYALLEDRMGSVPLTDVQREKLRRLLEAASRDLDFGVRVAAVQSLSNERDEWAIAVLEQMYERGPSLHAAGEPQRTSEELRSRIREAMAAIRARAAMPSHDFEALQAVYRELGSSSLSARTKALDALAKREGFLGFIDTPERLLRQLRVETKALRSQPALAQQGTVDEAAKFYERLLMTTWQAWKQRLTSQSFRILAEAVYDPDSAFRRELGPHVGRFLGEVLRMTDPENPPPLRINAVWLLVSAMAEDEAGRAPLAAERRNRASGAILRLFGDKDQSVRSSVFEALRHLGGAWAIRLLEAVYDREPSLREEVETTREAIAKRSGQQ